MRDAFAESGAPAPDAAALRPVPDLRGMLVEDAGGLRAGSLWGAFAEAETGLLRYLDLALGDVDRHVLVPIGHARVHEQDSGETRIRLRAALLEQLEQIPPFPADVDHIDDPFERALLEAYGRTFHGERYYAHPAYDHSGVFVGEHPVIGDEQEDVAPLTRLSYLPDWEVASGEPDIRGWPLVLEGDSERVPIRDLIVDTLARKVRYVVLETPAGGARILPIGFITIDAPEKLARAPALEADDIMALPPYDGGGVARMHEDRVHAALRLRLTGSRRYLLPDFRASDV